MDTSAEETIRTQAKKDGITHISTGIAVVRDGKILLVRRAADDYLGGYYELPGGGVDEGETIQDAALREVIEETGLTPTKVLATFKGFDYSTDKKPRVRQVNFLVEVAPGVVQLSSEHDDYLWVDADGLQEVKTTDAIVACVTAAFGLLA